MVADPNLTYLVGVNATNASLIPIVLNVTLNPPLNITLFQPQQSLCQMLLQSGGTFLAGIIALISFMWLNLRGPKLICSPIRDISFYCSKGSSGIIPKFILSNVGGSSVVIEFIALELQRISPNKEEYRFISAYEGSIEEVAEKGERGEVTNLDNPVSPFIIQNGKAVVKEITFMHSPEFDFIKGEYILKLFIKKQSYRSFWRGYISRFRKGDKEKEIRVLEQKVNVKVGLSYKGDGRMQFKKIQVLDPTKDELEL